MAEILATIFGLLGTVLLLKPGRLAPWGFVAWMVSNPAAMWVMWQSGHWWLLGLHTLYWLLAMASAWNWLIKPRLKDNRPAVSNRAAPTPCVCPTRDALDKVLRESLQTRVAVEQALFDMAAGKVPMPDASRLRELAIKLGTPSKGDDSRG